MEAVPKVPLAPVLEPLAVVQLALVLELLAVALLVWA